MSQFVIARRSGDLILSVIKDSEGRFIIVDSNDEFLKQFGYGKSDIVGKYLKDFTVGDATMALSEIESGDSVFDICDLLPRVSNFTFLTFSKSKKLVKLKVFRAASEENPKQEQYEIVMRDFSVSEKFLMFKKKNSLAVLNGADPLGLMLPSVTKSEMELVLKFVKSDHDSSVTILCICPDVQHEFIPMYRNNISQALISTLRSEDKFGTLENGVVITFLMGCESSFSQKAANRIYNKVNERLKSEKSVTVSMSYADASTFSDTDSLIESLINCVGRAREAGGGRIVAV